MTRVLVVGANGTLARATIRCLLEDGYLDITMACRTLSKGMDARQQILTSTPNADADQLRVVGAAATCSAHRPERRAAPSPINRR